MSTIRVTNIQAIGASNPALVVSGASVTVNSGLVIESGITIGTDVGASGQFIMSQGANMPVVYSTPTVDVADDIEVVTITATGNLNTFVSGFDLVQATTGDFLEITAFEENNGFIRTFSGDFHDLVIGEPSIYGAFLENPALTVIGSGIFHSGVFITSGNATSALALYTSATNTTGPNIVIGATGVADGSTNRSNIAIGLGALGNLENARSNNLAIGTNAMGDATAGQANVALGHQAGQNIRPGGNTGGNVFVGANAGQGDTNVNNNTQDCTFVGNQAGINVLQGRDHVAIGKEAMRQHEEALESGNVCVGVNAFRDAQQGELNTVIGHHAAEDSTGGDENVFIGAFAGQNNTVSGNTAVGFNALNANTNGESNVAVGFQSLLLNTTGENNTAVGVGSLDANTIGSSNVAIGRNALGLATSGDQNVAMGQSALGNLANGNLNTCIGHGAGNTIGNDGSNNTIIGAVQGTIGLNDTVIIGAGQTERMRIDNNGATEFFGQVTSSGFDVDGLQVQSVGGFGCRVRYGADIPNNITFLGVRLGGENQAFAAWDGTNLLANIEQADGSAMFASGQCNIETNGDINLGDGAGTGTETEFGVSVGRNGFVSIQRASANGANTVFQAFTGNNIRIRMLANGTCSKPGGGSWTDIDSERRLKQNLTPVDPVAAWNTIKTLPYYSYQFISDPENTYYGPVVDECPADMQVTVYNEVSGELVVRADDEGPLRTYDNKLRDARLFVALQEALKRIETLEAEVAALKAGG